MSGLLPDTQDEEAKRWQALLGMDQLQAPMLQDASAQAMAHAPVPQAAPHQSELAQAYQALTGGSDALPAPPHVDYTNQNAGYILAMFADALLNRGRGAGGLIGSMAARPDAAEANYKIDRQHALDVAELQHKAQEGKKDPEAEALRRRALDLQARGLDLEAQRLNGKTDAATGARDAAIALGADPKMIANMTDAQVNAWKGAITAQMRQQGSNQAWNDRQGQRVEAQIAAEGRRPDIAAATTAAQTGARLDATIGTPDQAISDFLAANPKLEVADAGTFRSTSSNPRTAALRQQQLMTATRALDASEALRKIEAEYSAIPFAQRLGDKALALSSEYDTLVNEHQGILQKIAAQGSGSAGERGDIRGQIPSIHNPIASSRLAGIEKMLHLNVGANLAPYGIAIKGDHGAAPGGGRQDSSGPDPHHPGAFIPASGKYLPVTDSVGPKVNQVTPPRSGGRVHIQKPDGQTGWIDAADLPKANALGAKVIP